jgi:DNA adenine methylase
VNQKGSFNAPFGRFKNPNTCDETNLRAVSARLHQGVFAQYEEFSAVTHRAAEGDLVYFDPPYVPLSPSSNFTAYTPDGFGFHQHQALRDVALVLKQKGAHVIVSNSACPIVEDLYADHFKIERVQARRNINSKGAGRGPIDEFIIT